MTLPITAKPSPDGKTLSLAWPTPNPLPDGYEFFRDGVRISHTLNAQQYAQPDGSSLTHVAIPDANAHSYGVQEFRIVDGGTATYPPPTPPPPPTPSRFFAPDAWPNARAADHWNPLPYSAQVVSLLAADAGAGGVWANGTAAMGGAWSTTLYYERDATTTRTIHDNVNNTNDTVPWNPAWKPSPDSDAHITIIFNDGRYYETEGLDQTWAGGYGHCAGAAWGRIDGDAIPTPKTRHVAGAPCPAGLILPSEIAAGVIPHATKGATKTTGTINSVASVYPSWGNDGSHNPGIPMGTWFALPASFDTSKYSGAVRMVAEAWKTYGHYITDTGGGCVIAVQSTAQAGVVYPFSSLSIPAEVVRALVALAPLKASY